MPTATINGFDMHYQARGDGPTVVWLHGLMGSIARQEQLGEGLGNLASLGYRVITYDARGHGESGFTEVESHYSWESHAADLFGLFEHLGIQRAVVGGGSMGAGISIAFALAHPERVDGLILVAAPPMEDTIATAQQLFNAFADVVESSGPEAAADLAMQLPAYAELKESDPEQYESMRGWLLSQRPQAVVPAIRGLLNGPQLPQERFKELPSGTLIIGFPDDPIHPLSSVERLHAAIAGSRLLVAPEPRYLQENPHELPSVAGAFLRGEEPNFDLQQSEPGGG